MNEREHVVNAVLLSIGLAVLLEPSGGRATLVAAVTVGPPVVLGALFPDVDTSFGTHRKTLHNPWVLAGFYALPVVVGTLQYVWVGVATHYVLDLLGTEYGMALLYPSGELYDVPVGVATDSAWALPVTLAVTALELAAVVAAASLGLPVDGLGDVAVSLAAQ